MQQVADFIAECEVLHEALQDVEVDFFSRMTQFKNWTVDDVVTHLHFWNLGVDQALDAGDGFLELLKEIRSSLEQGGLRAFENARITERGPVLLDVWRQQYQAMATRWSAIDPRMRIRWAGPDMSARSAISARQMETWAHGQAVFDLLGLDRPESDRLRNIVFLGVNAFGWSHRVHGLDIPDAMPRLNLVSPSGNLWEFGDSATDCISGSAVEFCQVITQTRNVLDTSLVVEGKIARQWMENAQCFAGPAEKPPAPGTRFKC